MSAQPQNLYSSRGKQVVKLVLVTLTGGPGKKGPLPASAAHLRSSEADVVVRSYPKDSVRKAPLQRDVAAKPSRHGAICRGRCQGQIPAPGESGGSGAAIWVPGGHQLSVPSHPPDKLSPKPPATVF